MTGKIQQHPIGRKVIPDGFSLLELVIAMGLFLVLGGASLTLFSRHETLLGKEQGIAGLNIGLRNALSQIQIDASNAGYGLIMGANAPAWPVGITIYNSDPTAAQCNPTATNPPTYAAACFDKFNVVMVDPNTPYLQLPSSYNCTTGPLYTNGTVNNILTTETTSSLVGTPGTGSSSTYYSNFKSGDQILLVKANGQLFTTATLSAAGTNSSPNVQLTFHDTQIGGFNYSVTSLNDPLLMTTPYGYVTTTAGSTTVSWVSGNTFVTGTAWNGMQIQIGNNTNYTVASVTSSTSLTLSAAVPTGQGQTNVPLLTSATLTNQFCSGDFVLRLLPIQYSVSVANASDPQLVRTQGTTSNVVMDQVIGFKVGAAWWDNNTSTFAYCYNTGPYCDSANTVQGYNGNFTLVRAVRVSLIGRTTPSSDPTYTYRNLFDSGPYQIRGNSIIVNPRNLTMNND